jgi:hypothetical protein
MSGLYEFSETSAQALGGTYDASEKAMRVNSVQSKFRDNFSGTVLDPAKWVLTVGSGMTATVNNGLVITAGTTSGSETIMESIGAYRFPLRAMLGIIQSQKVAGQEVHFELVSVDETTLAADGKNACGFLSDGADAMNLVRPRHFGFGRTTPVIGTTFFTAANLNAATGQILELEPSPDEVWWHTRASDSGTARSTSVVRQSDAPDPTALYKLRIRVKNTAALASSTTITIQYVVVTDYAELTAEITAGRGANSAGQALPVYMAGAINLATMPVANNAIADTSTVLAAGATYTGTAKAVTSVYNTLGVEVKHLAGSAPGHLVIETSFDNSTFDVLRSIPIPSDGLYRTFFFPLTNLYYRIKFVNGATAQTAFSVRSTIRSGATPANDMRNVLNFDLTALVTASLAAGASYSTPWLDLGPNSAHARIRAGGFLTSVIGDLRIEFSPDASTVRFGANTVAASAGATSIVESLVMGRYARVTLKNTDGAAAATAQGLWFSLLS